MANADHKRSDRVAERLRAELMDLLLRGEMRDPGAQGVFVSDVRVSDDLSYARVYVRLLEPEAPERRRRAAVRAMERATGFLRSRLAAKLKLKRMPELTFHWDEVVDRARRIEGLLEEVRHEDQEESGGSS